MDARQLISNEIRNEMTILGGRQDHLAREYGINPVDVSILKRGKGTDFTVDKLITIAGKLGIVVSIQFTRGEPQKVAEVDRSGDKKGGFQMPDTSTMYGFDDEDFE